MSKFTEVCHRLTAQYSSSIWSKLIQGIKRYDLIQPNDKIAVCLSGGKDSFLLAIGLLLYKKYLDSSVEIVILMMDPGYDKENLDLVLENIKDLDLEVQRFETKIFAIVKDSKSPCYGCAKMRRGALYTKAKELGCNKIALGHHYNDVIETTLMSMFYTGSFSAMLPKLKSTAHEGMELIRPLYLVEESYIIDFWRTNQMQFIRCACLVTKKASCDSGASKRKEIKELIQELKKQNPFIEQNLFKSLSNVYLEKVLGYVDKEGKKTFLDLYEEVQDV